MKQTQSSIKQCLILNARFNNNTVCSYCVLVELYRRFRGEEALSASSVNSLLIRAWREINSATASGSSRFRVVVAIWESFENARSLEADEAGIERNFFAREFRVGMV